MVTLEALRFGYRRGEPIIDQLDAVFAPGEVTAITGRSGRGKSTLLYLVGLLLTPWSGRIDIGELIDASAQGDAERSRVRAGRVGFVFQDAVLDPSRTVLDNVTEPAVYAGVPRNAARAEAERLLERFGVVLRADRKPGEVSGGQAQRIALCRALLNRPAVILADEPTGNLDAASATVVIEALTGAAREQKATVLIASHDHRVAAASDQAIKL